MGAQKCDVKSSYLYPPLFYTSVLHLWFTGRVLSRNSLLFQRGGFSSLSGNFRFSQTNYPLITDVFSFVCLSNSFSNFSILYQSPYIPWRQRFCPFSRPPPTATISSSSKMTTYLVVVVVVVLPTKKKNVSGRDRTSCTCSATRTSFYS